MGIMVRAIRLGVYDNRRQREGAVFEIQSEKDFGSWMEYVEDPPIAKSARLRPQTVQTATEAQKSGARIADEDQL